MYFCGTNKVSTQLITYMHDSAPQYGLGRSIVVLSASIYPPHPISIIRSNYCFQNKQIFDLGNHIYSSYFVDHIPEL